MNYEIILQFVTVLRWPFVVLVVGYFLRNEIKGLINRVRSGKLPGGFEFQSLPSQQNPNTNVPLDIDESAETRKVELETEYKKMAQDNSALKEQIDNLLTQIAKLQTALLFERMYQSIFGSQIKLLEELQLRGTAGTYYEDISAHYEQTRKLWPSLNSYALETYLNYLSDSKLIESFMELDRKKYRITAMGIDFLEYIKNLNYAKNKTL